METSANKSAWTRTYRTAIQAVVAFVASFLVFVLAGVSGEPTLSEFIDTELLDRAAAAGVVSAVTVLLTYLQNTYEVRTGKGMRRD